MKKRGGSRNINRERKKERERELKIPFLDRKSRKQVFFCHQLFRVFELYDAK